MFQGTGSDVGKSLIVAGLCRLFANRGIAVRPFKPQNMSNNAAVTAENGEIGRAQALQARAARVAASTDMNPILLKPQSQIGAQIIVQGRMMRAVQARDFQAIKPSLMPAVLESFAHLKKGADIVLVEGAGSPAEINLRVNDIANMGFARAADIPVVLIGDIDRGGVIASIVGTKAVLDASDASLVQGFIVNRLRGDASLFADGMAAIEAMTGWRAMGLVPHFDEAARLPAEDGLALRDQARWTRASRQGTIRVSVPVLAHIANFDDLDPLRLDPAVDVMLLEPGKVLSTDTDLVLLVGSKATIADIRQLREVGWDIDIKAHARRGGYVLGLCGGYQMLGRSISDPDGIEGPAANVAGLGLLNVDTNLTGTKRLRAVCGETVIDGVPFSGYEMHVGDTVGPDTARPLVRFADGRLDGAMSTDHRIAGTYAHGLFADDRQRRAWIARLGGRSEAWPSYDTIIETTLDGLARHLEQHLNVDALLTLAR
jgi:adenosylcobyric acid synthase